MDDPVPHQTRYVNIRSSNRSVSCVKVNIIYERDIPGPSHHYEQPPVLEQISHDLIPDVSSEATRQSKRFNDATYSRYPPKRSTLRFSSIEEMDTFCSTTGIELNDDNWLEEGGNFIFLQQDEPAPNCSKDELMRTRTGRFVICRLCGVSTHPQKRRQHIYIKHLLKKLYLCPYCDTSHPYHRLNIDQHIRRVHHSSASAISIKEELSREIDVWMYKCFQDRRLLRFIPEEVAQTVYKLVDLCCDGFSEQSKMEPEFREEFDDEEDKIKVEKIHVRKTSVCKVCAMKNIKHLERHVLQYHLKKATFLCPYCTYGSNYALNAVKDHIKTKHGQSGLEEPIDLRGELWMEIRRHYEACFLPNPAESLKDKTQPQFYQGGSSSKNETRSRF